MLEGKEVKELNWLDATETAALIAAGEITSGHAVEAALERMARINPELNAVIHEFPE